MNVIIIILLLISVFLLFIFVFKILKRRAVISNIISKYPIQASTLCRTNIGYLDANVKLKILTFPLENWEDWSKKVNELICCSKSYPEVMSEYILYYFPNVKDAPNYKEFKIFTPEINRCKILIECLQYDDVLKLSQISHDEWLKRKKTKSIADAIILSNPDAITELRKKDPTILDEDIIKNQRRIEQIQKRYYVASAFNDWCKKQSEFCTIARNLRDEFAKNCGCYTYDIEFERPLSNGKSVSDMFKIWQIFVSSISPFYLEYQPESSVTLYKELSEFKDKTRYYFNSVYENAIPYIEALAKDKSIVVLFNNYTSYNWNIDTYNYHYNYLSSLLSKNSIDWIDVEKLNENLDDFDYDIAFVFDFITVNSDLKYISKNIIESFSKKVPVIVWYSMIKEYDKQESFNICKDAINAEAEKRKEIEEKAKKEKEQLALLRDKTLAIDYIKSQLLVVNKHPFFSYFAITNTLIGTAAHANSVKPLWLSNHDSIKVETIDKNDYIAIKYSLNGGSHWIKFERKGDVFNIDDVSIFTYELFKEMNVLPNFLSKGEIAIDYINTKNFLAYR